MSAEDDLQKKFSDIGVRYLARTQGELSDLRTLVDRLRSGDAAAVKDLELLAHRIHGSGAVFGFHDLSNAAGAVETLAVDTARSGTTAWTQIADQASGLVDGVAQALQTAQANLSR
jgi:HPt (histidine-containing phosphotransfer) domain-containing protein